jgi:hypothetical protein
VDRAVRHKMMMFLLLISYRFWPLYHGLLFVHRCVRRLLKGHLNWLISHSVSIYYRHATARSWLPNRSLLHLDYVLKACLDWLRLSNHGLVLFIVWSLLHCKRLLVLVLLWRHNTCPAKNNLATLWCCMLFVSLNLNLWSRLKSLLARSNLINTVWVLIINILILALLWLLFLLILMLWVFWLLFLFIEVLSFKHDLYLFILSHRL